MKKPFESWADRFAETGARVIQYPSETLVRLMKGTYVRGLDRNYDGKRVLEVGFAYGANLQFMKGLGLEVYGVEVHANICKTMTERLLGLGISSVLKPGSNREIPFPDGFFDYLVSWDTLHYETSEELVCEAIREFGRVLKPSGRFFLSTVAPGHTILLQAERLDQHRYRIREETFRKGQVFFCLDSPGFIEKCFSTQFQHLQIGRTTIHLFESVNDCFVATGVKA